MFTLWILLLSLLVLLNCSLVGTFLMLRKEAMVGDAIAHSTLFGIVLAFSITRGTHFLAMMGGSIAVALFMLFFIRFLVDRVGVRYDAALVLTSTTLFSLGVIWIGQLGDAIDLDQGCVLYGQLVARVFDQFCINGYLLGPKDLYVLLFILLLNGGLLARFYSTWVLLALDSNYATIIGIPILRWEQLWMVMTTTVAVASFRVVGVPLVLGAMILPPTTAYLISNHLPTLIQRVIFIDLVMVLYGYHIGYAFNISLPGSMILVGGALFLFFFFKEKKTPS